MSKIKMEGRELLLYLSLKYNGDFNKMFEAIKNKEAVDPTVAQQVINGCGFSKEEYVTILDSEYPEQLKTMRQPPFVLYMRLCDSTSNLLSAITVFDDKFNKNKPICVVGQGDNNPTYWNDNFRIGDETKDSIMTTDGNFVSATVRNHTVPDRLIIFAGSGIDISQNIAHTYGLYVSEYPNSVKGCRANYERRGIIMSHLCKKMCVVNIDENSAAAKGIINANAIGREVEFITPDTGIQGTRSATLASMLKNSDATVKHIPINSI